MKGRKSEGKTKKGGKKEEGKENGSESWVP